MKRIILTITISYIIGLIWGLYFNKNITLLFCLFIGIYSIAKKKYAVFLVIISIAIACLSINYENSIYDNTYTDLEECSVTGKIIDEPQRKENIRTYTLNVYSVNNDKRYKNTKVIVREKTKKDANTEATYGSVVKIKGKFEIASKSRNNKGYNYNYNLRSKKIHGTVITDSNSISICKANDVSLYQRTIHSIQIELNRRIHEILPEKTAGLYECILLGNKGKIDEITKNEFSESSLSHILAVSGMHLNYIVVIISMLCSKCGLKHKKIMIIISSVIFCNIAGNSYSLVRATIMTIMYVASGLLHRKADSLTNIAIAAFLILLYNPYAIVNTSFILSFAATLSIILFYKPINNIIPDYFEKNKAIKYVKESISLSISANILLVPVMAVIFKKITFSFIISNVFATFLLCIIMPLGIGCIALTFFSIKITKYFSFFLDKFLILLILLAKAVSKIKFLKILVVPPNLIQLAIYICGIFVIFARNTKLKLRKVAKKLIVALIIISLLLKVIAMFDTNMKIYFIDVGQGDSTLIITPHGKNILIDGGGSEDGDYVGKNTLLPYLLSRGIRRIDYMIISHFDTDHVGGLITIMEELAVRNIILSKEGQDSKNYRNVLEIAKNKKIKIIEVDKGDKIKVEKDLYIDIIWPNNKVYVSQNAINNNSIVCKITYKTFSCMFTGDIESIAEEEIVKEYERRNKVLSATVLKVAHHGSDSSSSSSILQCINPKIALIGVGKNNKFGHPSDEIVSRLEKEKIEVYRTDNMGEISITVKKNGDFKIKKHIE